MKLTIGMAHHMDFSGAYFTIQHIIHTTSRLKDIEFVVVDNSPNTQHGKDLKSFVEGPCRVGTAEAIYVPVTQVYGTSQTRNLVFSMATSQAVMCVDCHITLEPHAADRLLDFYESFNTTNDLYQGPMLNDYGQIYATHFEDVWRDQMWGIWGTDKRAFATADVEALPIIDRIAMTKYLPPFEIPAMGLGLFSCRKEAWLGFNPNFRGFGGEEWYIHHKYRQAGHKCWCLPWLRWGHRFGRPEGVGYTLSMDHKVRNYILGHQELGMSLDRVYEHFVVSGLFPKEKWDWLLADPVLHVPEQAAPPTMLRRQGQAQAEANALAPAPARVVDMSRPQPPQDSNLDEVFTWCQTLPRDLEKHLPLMREWAAKCGRVTEFTERRESTVGFLAGRPTSLISYNTENDYLLTAEGVLHQLAAKEDSIKLFQTIIGNSLLVPEIAETDLLFVDTEHTGTRLRAELERHGARVTRAIMVHDTHNFGHFGDGGQPGLFSAFEWWMEQHPKWFIAHHTQEQYGMTVLSCHPDDKPAKPIRIWAPGFGPGSELKKILASVGINPTPGCDCNAKMMQMDIWGPDECSVQCEQILGWLRAGEEKWGWKSQIAAAVKLAIKDPLLAITLNPVDPYPGLVKAAIKRAKKEELKKARFLKTSIND